MSNGPRPSRKHVLDWLGGDSFKDDLNHLLGPSGVRVGGQDIHRPVGHGDGVEFELPDFCWCFRPRWKVHESSRTWWLPPSAREPKARTPLWDLISTCSVLGRKGLLLVEAKSHEGELDWNGKPADAVACRGPSKSSHDRIRAAVGDISHWLTSVSGTKVIRDIEGHHQLTQRVAWAAFLASQGIPVTLLYLGFTGDLTVPGFLKDDAHWQRLMGGYMLGKVSLCLPEKLVRFPGGGLLRFLIRSRPVLELTPNGHQHRVFKKVEVGTPKAKG